MSKRATKAQRRALLREIDNLRIAYNRESWLLSDCTKKLVRLRAEMGEAKRILGQHCSVLPAVYMESPYTQIDHMCLPLHMDLETRSSAMKMAASLTRVDMHFLLSSARIEEVRREMHVHVKFRDGRWGYAMSEESARNTPHDILVRRISDELALRIADDLKRIG